MTTLLGPLTRGQWPPDPKVNSGRGETGTNLPVKPHRDTHYESPSPQSRSYSSDEEEVQEIVNHIDPQEDEHSGYVTPPEPTDQEADTGMPSQEHKNMQEAVDDMDHYLEMNKSKRQGGGDIEPISPPGLTTSP